MSYKGKRTFTGKKKFFKKPTKKEQEENVEEEEEEEEENVEAGEEEQEDEEDGEGEESTKKVEKKKTKTTKAATTKSSSSSSKNEKSISLGPKRKISYSDYKGLERIDIREYYDAGGELKPSNKGISLTKEQFLVILENGDTIKEWIK